MQSIKDIIKPTFHSNMTMQEMAQYKADMWNADVGNLNETDGYNCDICKNKEYIMKIVEQRGYYYETLVPCKCHSIRQSIRKMKKSGLGHIIKDCTFDKYETTEQWQGFIKTKAINFVNDENKSIFFIGGQSGCGKSHICTAICRELIYKGNEVRYMRWRDDVPKLKAVLNEPAYHEQMRKLKTVKVLYIDDLFKTGNTDKTKAMLPTGPDASIAFELIDHRYNDKDLITIISSELQLQHIIDIDEAIGGRIAEKSMPDYCINIKADKSKNYRTKGLTEI
jgi:DNA replication protein DnaC